VGFFSFLGFGARDENPPEPPGYPGHYNHLRRRDKEKEWGNAFRRCNRLSVGLPRLPEGFRPVGRGGFPRELKSLFPAGFTKGACRLAGITFRDRFMDYYGENLNRRAPEAPPEPALAMPNKEYRVDSFGFLVDPASGMASMRRTKPVR
jgi:hypothetical protein